MRNRIVVTGLGIVSPLGNDLATTWDGISKGKSGISRITKFDATSFSTQIAGEVKDFSLGKIVPHKELKKMDEFIQYSLKATDEAIKHSKLEITEDLAPEVGVSIGVGIGGLPNIEKYRDIVRDRGPGKITPFFIPMTISNMAAGYVSIFYGAKGYCACTTSACSSASHSIGDASRIIERGDAKVMIVGGVEATICPLAIGGFGSMKALSRRNDQPEKASRPYDEGRDGFVLGEGAGILILEEYEFARSRGAKILAEISGYGFSSDAFHITTPSSEGPIRAMKMALKDSGRSPEEIDYVNAHGTSTLAGDINELNALKAAFDEKNCKNYSISSTKSMTGHLLGGSGALESVLCIQALQENLVPPTINVENLDPECDLDITANAAKKKELNVILNNSFGFGGTNTSIIFNRI